MPRYSPLWVELARATYQDLPASQQRQIDTRISQLLQDPRDGATYNARSDQWTTTFGNGTGMIAYAIVDQHVRIIVLRLLV